MSNIVLVKYFYTCSAGDTVSEWRTVDDGVPTQCKDNTSHTVVSNTIRIKERRNPSIQKIQEEETETQGNYMTESIELDIPSGTAGDLTTKILTWDYDINVLSTNYVCEEMHRGDVLEVFSGEDTVVGAILESISAAISVIPVSATVILYAQVGYLCKISDGVNTDDLGIILSIDSDASTITVKQATTNAFTTGNILLTRKMISRIFGGPSVHSIGGDKIGASYLPTGTQIKIAYTNNTTDAKKLIIDVQYLY